MKIVIATIKSWNIDNAEDFIEKHKAEHDIRVITGKENLTEDFLQEFSPNYVFFPHWSYIIPASIFESFNCVVFHMTDLPYGRGGSPLQNLIVRGRKDTKISAIKVTKGLDEGPIYFKEDLSLSGSADEIFRRASDVIFEKMMPRFLSDNLVPNEQIGEPVIFKRRKPAESEIKAEFSINKIYDYIRMLDAEGYPHAFVRLGEYKLELVNGSLYDDAIEAKVIIRKENHE